MSISNEETARRHAAIRREIARILAEAAPVMALQARRMDALGQGHPDPHPEADQEFADRIVEAHRTSTDRAPGRAP